jgi:uncharacterized membrane protein YdjX (TVP38/TMEM64 family)
VSQERRLGIAVTLAAVAGLGLLALAIDPLGDAISAAIHGDAAALREEIDSLGVGGALIVLGLALIHAFVWYPTEILTAAAGFVYGVPVALPLMVAGWLANGLLCFWIGRNAARPLLLRLLGEKRFLRYEAAVGRGGIPLLLAMRLVPIVPFSLFSYVAGSARVPVAHFAWTTVVGYLPLTILFVYLGSRLEELSLSDPLLWIGALVLIALVLLSSRVVRMLAPSSG